MRGNFRLKQQNSPKLPHMYMLDFIVMQFKSEINCENGYCSLCGAFIGMVFDTMKYPSVKPWMLMKNIRAYLINIFDTQ